MMPRKKLIRQDHFPYHITSRCNNKDWFNESLDIIWSFFIISLQKAQKKYPVNIHSFILMNNHYHLMLTTPHADLDKFMFYLNRNFSDLIRKKTNRINHLFAGRYRWSIIDNRNYLFNVYRYIYQNPIRAQIVKRCEDFPYSSIHWELNQSRTLFKIWNITDEPIENLLEWLNQEISKDKIDIISKGLRKSYFKVQERFNKDHHNTSLRSDSRKGTAYL